MSRSSRRNPTATCDLSEIDQARSLDPLLYIVQNGWSKRDVADDALSPDDMPRFMNLNYTANSSDSKHNQNAI